MHRFANSSLSTGSASARPREKQILKDNQEMRQSINELEHLIQEQNREHKTIVSKRADLEHEFVNFLNHQRAKEADIEAKEMQHFEEIRQHEEAIRTLNERLKQLNKSNKQDERQVAKESQLGQLRASKNGKERVIRDGLQEQTKNFESYNMQSKTMINGAKDEETSEISRLTLENAYLRRQMTEMQRILQTQLFNFSRDASVQNLKDTHEKETQRLKENATRAKVIPSSEIQAIEDELEPRSRQKFSTRNRSSIDPMPVTRGQEVNSLGQQEDKYNKYKRLRELHERNALARPHLQESYFIEAQSPTAYAIIRGRFPNGSRK